MIKHFKRVMIFVVGGTVLVIGIAMILLPGPAFIVIPTGLAILAIEFAWARRWLRSARAVMPKRTEGHILPEKITMKSFRRSMEFLLRQIRRTPKRKVK
jgi:uncharacterized protein (TIGR02611 family)